MVALSAVKIDHSLRLHSCFPQAKGDRISAVPAKTRRAGFTAAVGHAHDQHVHAPNLAQLGLLAGAAVDYPAAVVMELHPVPGSAKLRY